MYYISEESSVFVLPALTASLLTYYLTIISDPAPIYMTITAVFLMETVFVGLSVFGMYNSLVIVRSTLLFSVCPKTNFNNI